MTTVLLLLTAVAQGQDDQPVVAYGEEAGGALLGGALIGTGAALGLGIIGSLVVPGDIADTYIPC